MLKRILFLKFGANWTPVVLAAICLLAHGIFIPWLGFFADDWTYLWTTHILGYQGELRYFFLGNNRPLFGILHHLIINLLGSQPWVWHLFGIFWLWLTSVMLWWLVRLVWPGNQNTAFYAAALFAIYPGFQLQLISLTIGHMWLVLACLFFSFCMNILAVRQPNRFLLYSVFAVIFSLVNLLTFEYFFMLELVRPVFLWLVIRQSIPDFKEQIRRTLTAWLPYAILFAGIFIWRTFFFVLQTEKYQLSLTEQMRAEPVTVLFLLLKTIFQDVFWDASLFPWLASFKLPLELDWSNKSNFLYLGLCLFILVLVYLFLSKMKPDEHSAAKKDTVWQMVPVGLFALFIAGWPFWFTGLEVIPVYWNSRFTMPFVFGTALLLTGLISLLRVQKLQWGMLALLVGFAAGYQFHVANEFRRDWQLQSEFIKQLSWRIPALPPGTTIFSNELPFKYFSDNTLSAELNWIASRGEPGYQALLFLAYPKEMIHLEAMQDFKQNSFRRDMMSIDFYGSMDQVIGVHFQSDSCLRLLDPRFDPGNVRIPDYNREIAKITKPELILLGEKPIDLSAVYAANSSNDWCYIVQMADIARSKGDWEEVARLGDQLDHTSKSLYRDPMIAVIFIEGYARSTQFETALDLSARAQMQYYYFKSTLCPVWRQIDQDLGDNPLKEQYIRTALEQHKCQ
jgi:hypothetical protein